MKDGEADEPSSPHRLQEVEEPKSAPSNSSLHAASLEESFDEAKPLRGTRRAVLLKFHQGLVDDPDTLAKYAQLDPALPDRIISIGEAHSAHVRNEERLTREQIGRENSRTLEQGDRGQHYALIVVLAVLALAWRTLELGFPSWAVVIATADIATVAGVFLLGGRGVRRQSRKRAQGSERGRPASPASDQEDPLKR